MIRDVHISDFGFKIHPRVTLLNWNESGRIFFLGEDQLLELNNKLEVIKKVESPFHTAYNYIWQILILRVRRSYFSILKMMKNLLYTMLHCIRWSKLTLRQICMR